MGTHGSRRRRGFLFSAKELMPLVFQLPSPSSFPAPLSPTEISSKVQRTEQEVRKGEEKGGRGRQEREALSIRSSITKPPPPPPTD